MNAGCDRSNSRSSAAFGVPLALTTSGVSKLTPIGTVRLEAPPLLCWIWMSADGMLDPATPAKPACGAAATATTTHAGIGTDRDDGAGVRAHRHPDIAQNLTEVVELFEIQVGRVRARAEYGDVAAAALRHQCNAQHLDADQRPIIRRRVADDHWHVARLRAGTGTAHRGG